jgi:hypothetical protein
MSINSKPEHRFEENPNLQAVVMERSASVVPHTPLGFDERSQYHGNLRRIIAWGDKIGPLSDYHTKGITDG